MILTIILFYFAEADQLDNVRQADNFQGLIIVSLHTW